MASVGEIFRYLDQKAPFSYQLDYDNAGFLLGREEAEVSRVLVALDASDVVVEEAIAQGVQLLVTHHPIIWGKLSALTDHDTTGRRLLQLLDAGIAVISTHTNLDMVEGGVNTVLAAALHLQHPIPLQQDGVDAAGQPYGLGRVGVRAAGETSPALFAQEVKAALGLQGLRLMDAGRPVLRVAVGGGACGSMLAEVLAQGCDTFVSAEFKHDVYLEAQAQGVNLIDAGHYGTEALVCPVLVDWLRAGFPTLKVLLSAREGEVFSYT